MGNLKQGWLFVCFMLLTSCSAVPLSTMMKMATLDNEDITSVNPDEIRVRVSLTDPVKLKTSHVRLVLKFYYEDQTQDVFQYNLKPLSETRSEESFSWLSNTPAKNIYEFKLDDSAQVVFEQSKKVMAKKGAIQRYRWEVYYDVVDFPADQNTIHIDLELKLAEDEGYFYLLKGADLVMENG